jgi:hypothetical protein
MLGMLLTLFLLVPGVGGLALGASAINRRLYNPPIVWIATIWNGLIVAGFVLLCIIGMFR